MRTKRRLKLDPVALKDAKKAFWRARGDSIEAAILAYIKALAKYGREDPLEEK
jgi:hypothetical protein